MSAPGLETDLAGVADALHSRYFGKYRGIVREVDAPTMRVRAHVPALGAADLGWATACVPYAGPDVGFVMLPEVDSGVWIEFESGDLSYPIWVGCYWRAGEVPAAAGESAKAIITKAGTLTFDDDAGSIAIEDANGNTLVVDSSGVRAQGSAGKIVVAATVKVNDGALEVS